MTAIVIVAVAALVCSASAVSFSAAYNPSTTVTVAVTSLEEGNLCGENTIGTSSALNWNTPSGACVINADELVFQAHKAELNCSVYVLNANEVDPVTNAEVLVGAAVLTSPIVGGYGVCASTSLFSVGGSLPVAYVPVCVPCTSELVVFNQSVADFRYFGDGKITINAFAGTPTACWSSSIDGPSGDASYDVTPGNDGCSGSIDLIQISMPAAADCNISIAGANGLATPHVLMAVIHHGASNEFCVSAAATGTQNVTLTYLGGCGACTSF